ncbi:MAG TPA: hypothetical protein VNC84_02505 [Gammaproteobacteria bacterium]|jgi:hypothetical protein|nr:hypothetical protein [Gammaproteobacteria bacterium]
MLSRKTKAIIIFLCLFCSELAISDTLKPISASTTPLSRFPADQQLYDQYPWGLMYYYGMTASNTLIPILTGHFTRWPEHIQSLELTHTLSPQNVVRRFFSPLVGVVQLGLNATVRNGSQEPTIYEVDPFFSIRWANFPWNPYLNTSFSIGEGVSYASSVPAIEKKDNQNTKRFLNYLMLEATFAPPLYPRLQLVAQIHHRSGAYGLYHAGNSGSNVVGLGVRYLFG